MELKYQFTLQCYNHNVETTHKYIHQKISDTPSWPYNQPHYLHVVSGQPVTLAEGHEVNVFPLPPQTPFPHTHLLD